jgi:NitT/TauT family transport system substrate-binding protein
MVVIAVLATVAGMTAPGLGQARSPVTLKFGNVGMAATYYAPILFAEKKGFFQEEGIRNESAQLSDPDLVRAVASGAVPLGIPEVGSAITAIERGASVRVVAGITDRYPYDLMVQPKYNSFADLRGKTFSIWSTAPGVALTLMKRVLARGGLKEDEYRIIAGGNSAARYAALIAGQVDGTIITTPHNSMAKKAGFKSMGQLHAIPALFAGLVVNKAWAEQNRAVVVAWLRAAIRGFRYVSDPKNEPEVVRTLAQDLKADPEILADDYKLIYREAPYIVSWDLMPSQRSMQGVVEILVEIGLAKKGELLSKYFDLSYLSQALREVGR